ncbi:hypothetical protein Q75_02520 [Bacillus coahuilensis p1.1.43]|uniref:ABC transporter substrate-binding protein n=1 Tax=Bacillus coahuilensis p1.1.43 TaxID=1150625 RepID=A0A147KBG2_9BACI|nr:zinc ABC transporter substrate-binding protein [Bacillus coahuilensis]KUP08516.1 hypothetical protein Q75_02520 [Bacillus coahuilensis p1.1.43]
MKKFLTLLLLVGVLAGCQQVPTTNNEVENVQTETEPLSIHTTLYPLQFFTEQIGGEFVEVESIIPLGADAHTFEPTSKQMIEIAEGDMFVFNGLGMEPYAEKMAESLSSENVVLVEATAELDTADLTLHLEDEHSEHADHDEHAEEDHHETDEHSDTDHHDSEEHEDNEHEETDEHGEEDHHETDKHSDTDHHDSEEHEDNDHQETDEHGEEDHHDSEKHDEEPTENTEEHHHDHGDYDPHVWLDPVLSMEIARTILDELIILLPDQEQELTENYEALETRLSELDQEFTSLVASKEQASMIVSHAAYGYWESRYGVSQLPISGLSPSEEPSQKQLTALVDTAKENNLQYVVFEQNVSGKIAETIRVEIGAEPAYLHNLSVLTESDIESNEDYFSIMDKNLDVLENILQ